MKRDAPPSAKDQGTGFLLDPFQRSELPADLVDRRQRRAWAREVSAELLRDPSKVPPGNLFAGDDHASRAARLFIGGLLARIADGDVSALGAFGLGRRRVAHKGAIRKSCQK